MKIADLRPGEMLLLWRRRRGASQVEVARELGVTLYHYRKMEAGEAPGRKVKLGRIQPHERLFLMRHRAGISVGALASELGISAFWLSQMERGRVPADRLESHWSRAGSLAKTG